MSRHFLANLSVILLLNIIIKPLYIFGIEIAVQNAVGAVSYGIYFAVLNSAYLLQVLNDFGLQIYNNRNVALSDDNLRSSFIPILKLKSVLTTAFVVLFIVLTGILGYWEEWRLIIPVGANLILVSLILFLRSNISGLGYYRADSILSVMDKGLLIIILGYILYLSDIDLNILYFAYAQTIALGLTVIVSAVFLIARGAFKGEQAPTERVGRILKQAAPFALAVFLMTIYTRIDAVMIEQIAPDGAYQSGAYAAGYRLLDAANMFAYLFAVLLLPMLTRSLGDPIVIRKLLSQGSRVMLALTVVVVSASIAFRTEVMSLLYTQANGEWAAIFGLLIASFIAIGGMYVFGTYLTARGDIRQMNVVYLSCVVLNILLNLFLIPTMGAIGAAVATLFTQTVATTVLVIMSLKKAHIRIHRSKLIAAMAFLSLCALISYGSLQITGPGWIGRFIAATILMAISALLTGLIRPTELRQFIQR